MDARVALFSPAKVNLFLAITERRADGFHNLVSVVAPVNFGDDLVAERRDEGGFSLTCDQPDVPVDETNLILRAAQAFAQRNPSWRGGVHFHLTKRTPMGAGLGGGSSNAVTALLALNRLAPRPLAPEALTQLATELGSDCLLFLRAEPLVMRGRGESVENLPARARDALRGQRLLLFKPSFGISTVWAYREMAAAAPRLYLPADQAEQKLQGWLSAPERVAELVFNNMESVAFHKWVALPVMLAWLRERFGLTVGMSGSGSACFALLPPEFDITPVVHLIREAWGAPAFVTEAKIS